MTGSNASAWRRVVAISFVAPAPATLIVTAPRRRARLPDPLPIHWSPRWPDQRGLIIRGGVLGYPRKTIGIPDIECASAAGRTESADR